MKNKNLIFFIYIFTFINNSCYGQNWKLGIWDDENKIIENQKIKDSTNLKDIIQIISKFGKGTYIVYSGKVDTDLNRYKIPYNILIVDSFPIFMPDASDKDIFNHDLYNRDSLLNGTWYVISLNSKLEIKYLLQKEIKGFMLNGKYYESNYEGNPYHIFNYSDGLQSGINLTINPDGTINFLEIITQPGTIGYFINFTKSKISSIEYLKSFFEFDENGRIKINE